MNDFWKQFEGNIEGVSIDNLDMENMICVVKCCKNVYKLTSESDIEDFIMEEISSFNFTPFKINLIEDLICRAIVACR